MLFRLLAGLSRRIAKQPKKTNWAPVKKRQQGTFLNKAGRMVFAKSDRSLNIKAYEAANPQHAKFLYCVMQDNSIATHFPRIRELRDHFLIVDWVAESHSRVSPESMAEILYQIHSHKLEHTSRCGFDYWHDHVVPRFLRAAALLRENDFASELVSSISAVWDKAPRLLMHPDLTPDNLIVDYNGQIKIIDNELLSLGGLPLLDVCNCARALAGDERAAFLRTWQARARAVPKPEYDATAAAWMARQVGSAFVAGRIDKCARLLEKFRNGDSKMPIERDSN